MTGGVIVVQEAFGVTEHIADVVRRFEAEGYDAVAPDLYHGRTFGDDDGFDAIRPGVPPLVEVAPGLRTPWLGLYGDEDTGIPVEQVEALRAAASLAPVPTRIERFAGAGHAFFNDARTASYDAAAAGAAWPLVLSWLRMNLPT